MRTALWSLVSALALIVLAVGPESSGEIASYLLSEDRGVFEREDLVVEDSRE